MHHLADAAFNHPDVQRQQSDVKTQINVCTMNQLLQTTLVKTFMLLMLIINNIIANIILYCQFRLTAVLPRKIYELL